MTGYTGRPTIEYYSLSPGTVVGVAATSQTHGSWAFTGDFNWTLSASAPTASARYWIGFSSHVTLGTTTQSPMGGDTYTGQSILGFRYSTAASDSSFKCVSCNAGVCAPLTSSSIVPVTGTQYKMRVESTSSVANFYINGDLVCTVTQAIALPKSAALTPSITAQNLVSTAKHMKFHRMTVRTLD